MTYKSKIIAMLLILNIINNTHCGDGGEPMTLYQGITIAGVVLLLNNIPSIFTSLKNNFYPTVSTKNKPLTSNSISLTPEQIKFQEIENKIDRCQKRAFEEGNYLGNEFAKFRELFVEAKTRKEYSVAMSTACLECMSKGENPESLEQYSLCLELNNKQADDKKIPQPESVDDEPKIDDPQN